MSPGPHRRILASAGTGKTWQLTTQWLALSIRDPTQRPEGILATTFTRAAAGEIRERILRRLAIASISNAAGDRERSEIASLEGMGIDEISAATCGATLRRLVDRLDRLQIRTLDSFFFALASGSAFELGLPLPLEPLDEHRTAALDRRAIEEAVEQLGDDADGLLSVLDALNEGHPGRSVVDLVERSCGDLVALARDAPESAWEWADAVVGEEPGRVDFGRVAHELDGFLRRLEEDRALGDGHVRNAVIADARRLRAIAAAGDEHQVPLEVWVDFLDKGAAGAVASKAGVYRNKPLATELSDLLEAPVSRARWRLARIAVHRTRAAATLAGAIERRRCEIMDRDGTVTYDSVTRAVGAHMASHPLGDLLRRIDARIEHLLLDEFQDTSRGQWGALRPLASEIAACGDGSRRFFAVGDLKQSIYGWRGGDPEILEHLGDRFEAGPGGVEFESEHLELSRRSTQAVLAAVNGIFETIATNEVVRDTSLPAAEWWGRIFGTHLAHRGESGSAELRLVEREPPGDANGGGDEAPSADEFSAKTRAVVELVAELRRRHPDDRIGVVVRRNRAVAELLAALRASGIFASGSGGGTLRDSAAVNAVLEFLRFCDQPDHTIAAFHVARSPLGPVVGLGWPSTAETRASIAAHWRDRLAVRGFASVLEDLGGRVGDSLSAGDRRRWRCLLDEAARLDRLSCTRPLEFVEAAESVRIGDGSSAPVTVLNIHQSKGLEFDSVICPDLEFDLKSPSAVLVSRGEGGRLERIVRRMRGLDHLPALAAVRDEADATQVRETLCCLYVALTRARDRLFMIVDAPKDNEKNLPKTAAGAIRAALAPDATEPGVAWRTGTSQQEPVSEGVVADSVASIEPVRRRFAFRRGGGRTRRADPPSEHEGESLGKAIRLDVGSSDAADRGTAIHALFEQIGFLEDGVPNDADLDRAIRRALPRREIAWRAERVAEFRSMLATPANAAALARPTDGPARVWRERPFVAVEGGAVRRGVIDRLVVVGEPGAWRRAEILDFKTDGFEGRSPTDEDLAAKADRYRGQLQSYRKEIAKQFGLAGESIGTRLLFVASAMALEVGDA